MRLAAVYVALGLNAAFDLANTALCVTCDRVGVEAAQRIVELGERLVPFYLPMTILGAVTFLPWFRGAFARAVALVPEDEELRDAWKKGVVIAFFIPIMNLFRPYQAMSALNRAIEPDKVPEPPPRVADIGAQYREPSVEAAPTRQFVPPAPVSIWWALWLGRNVTGIFVERLKDVPNDARAFANLVSVGAAIAAVVVIARIDGRLNEFSRRRAALG